jgi:hypothetical protein
MKAVPRVAVAVEVEVMAGAPAMGSDRLSESIAVPEPAALAAEMVTLKVPAATLGVPEMRPLVVLMERPPGRPVALKEVGEFSAVIW